MSVFILVGFNSYAINKKLFQKDRKAASLAVLSLTLNIFSLHLIVKSSSENFSNCLSSSTSYNKLIYSIVLLIYSIQLASHDLAAIWQKK